MDNIDKLLTELSHTEGDENEYIIIRDFCRWRND